LSQLDQLLQNKLMLRIQVQSPSISTKTSLAVHMRSLGR
jgi:hypothetical protein